MNSLERGRAQMSDDDDDDGEMIYIGAFKAR